ncbi:MAG: molybdopterin molybdotransferase MoeA [Candidatus Accumulibacter sp.]|nr:molybdopterin molybdotransferase MoeA [Accumulibacter sp.]
MLSFDEAFELLRGRVRPLTEVAVVPTLDAAGRVLAVSQRAEVDSPPADNSAMDGYAIAVADLQTAGTRLPVSQTIAAGRVGEPLAPGTAARIFTGGVIPDGADAVVMQELCQSNDGDVQIGHVPRPGEHVRRAGSDIAAGSEILVAGQRLRPQDIALAASVGLAGLPVYCRLRVAVLFTGDELRMPGETLPPGAIYNTNRFMLNALLKRLGCEVFDQGQIPDDLSSTRRALLRAAEQSDLIISSGGVSVGDEDHVKTAVAAEGRLELWKMAIKPGKPLAFGQIRQNLGREVPFIGLPGNPVSSLVTFLMLVRPMILAMQGASFAGPMPYLLRADFDWPRPDSRREFLRGRRNADGGVDLFADQGASILRSAVWSDGLIDNPPRQVIRRGDLVRFLPFAELLD